MSELESSVTDFYVALRAEDSSSEFEKRGIIERLRNMKIVAAATFGKGGLRHVAVARPDFKFSSNRIWFKGYGELDL